ncbi:hypothetical protein V6K52_17180 [Knoellia sp. S7-12]|uniref:hypothetical protein n=1 Tax=Knoellia sp. S7-12 TaxID=3126698 RepID=UPI003367E7A5
MNTHVLDPHTDAELRSLDAASDVSSDPDRRDAILTAILDTPAATHPSPPSLAPAPQRPPVRRWAAVGAIAAAATGVAIVLPTLTAAPSYASWTARPDTVTAAESALVRDACLDNQGSSIGDGSMSTKDLSVQLAERRGDFVTMLLSKREADRTIASVYCHVRLPAGSESVSDVQGGATGGGGLPAPAGRQFTQGGISEFGGDDGASITEGEVGPDVIGLTLHADGHDVIATITGGTYAAWWPGKAFADFTGPSGEGGPEPAITYDVTYADGTVAKDVQPTVPGGLGEIHTETAGTPLTPLRELCLNDLSH